MNKQRIGLVTTAAALLFSASLWFLLNRLRVHFCNSHGSPDNQYFVAIAQIQPKVMWASVLFAFCFAVSLLFEVVHFL